MLSNTKVIISKNTKFLIEEFDFYSLLGRFKKPVFFGAAGDFLKGTISRKVRNKSELYPPTLSQNFKIVRIIESRQI